MADHDRVSALTTAQSVTPFGASLRQRRRLRGLSQLQLAHVAQTTSRHLSFLETGRSRPSRDMVQRLSSALDLTLRETNRLLADAGLAAVYPETRLEDPDLGAFSEAIEQMLTRHEPYPAYVINRHWDIVRTNAAARRLLPPQGERNVVRLVYTGPWRDLIDNWAQVAVAGVARLSAEAARHPSDDVLAGLADLAVDATRHLDLSPVTPAGRVLCPHFRVGGEVVRTISVVAHFGGAADVTLDELRVELIFPADDTARRVLGSDPSAVS